MKAKHLIGICAAIFSLGLLRLNAVPAAAEGEVVVGLLAELSGAYAVNGEHCRQGYELARSVYAPGGLAGAHKVSFVYGDSRGEARQGIAEFERLTGAAKAIAVVSTRSSVVMPINPLSRRKGIPLLTTIGHADFVRDNPYGFRFWPGAEQVGRRSAGEAFARDKRRAALVSLEDEFTVSLGRIFVEEFGSLGGRVLLDEKVPESEVDFGTLAAKIKAAQPDLVFVNLGLVSSGLMIKKLREQGVIAQILGNSWMIEPSVAAAAGAEAIEGAFFVDFDFQRPLFLQKMQALFSGAEPMAVTYACYAALGTLLQTLHNGSDIRDAKSLYRALAAMEHAVLLDGDLPMREREAQLELVVRTIHSGRAVQP